jgi:RNA polymerase sigma-70 factor (sigma-E family)
MEAVSARMAGMDVTSTDPIDALYRRERTTMRRLAYLITGSPELAEEIVQEAFAVLHRRWETIDEPGAYLRTVVVRRAVAARRRRSAEQELLARAPPPWLAPEAVPAPEIDMMRRALAGLSPRRRAVLVLRFYGDHTTGDIATMLGCAPATVRSLLHRGLEQLRSEMGTWTS